MSETNNSNSTFDRKAYSIIYRKENKDKIHSKKMEWNRNNPEKILTYQKSWYLKNKEKVSNKTKSYRLLNPIRTKFNKYRYSAKKRGYEFRLSYDEFSNLVDKKQCYYCGSTGKVGIDRIDSSIGYISTNVLTSCWDCNRTKGKLSKDIFIKICLKIAENFNKRTL